ncbi:MAG: hypothetical protein J3Q66DRAFT_421343 [Benniella sp.]|nr:MAG: hypothetical protein J3Q66DRAFT_421343 [Benniella sp.]
MLRSSPPGHLASLHRQSQFCHQSRAKGLTSKRKTCTTSSLLLTSLLHSAMVIEAPELRQHIARFLDFSTLKAFSLVRKAWYFDAHPVLWDRFSCKVPRSLSSKEYTVWLDTIRKKANLFRHIHYDQFKPIEPQIRDLLLDQCHGLVTIETIVIDSQDLAGYWEGTFRPLVQQNRVSLRQLQLRTPSITIASLQLPNLLASLLVSLPQLRSLELGIPLMAVEDLLPVLNACSGSLGHLYLMSGLWRREKIDKRRSAGRPNSSITKATPLQIKHLRVKGACFDNTLEDILSRLALHSLEELQLETVSSLQMIRSLRDVLWRLTSLSLHEMHPSLEKVLPDILHAIHPHQLCHVYLGSLDTECTTVLIEQQHQSLESLSVTFMKDHTGALADIMATCRKLKSLTFVAKPFVDIRTLIDPQRPWTCTELEVFDGYFGLSHFPLLSHPAPPAPPPGSDLNEDPKRPTLVEHLFMQRLGQLTNLHSVVQKNGQEQQSFYDPFTDTWMAMQTMGWSMASGLAHLAGLANLRTLGFCDRNLPKGIGIHELVFMKQHWHGLKELACLRIKSDLVEWLATEWPELKVNMKPQRAAFFKPV